MAGLDGYARHGRGITQEFRSMVEPEIELLAEQLSALGWRGWSAWLSKRRTDVAGLIASTPADRGKRLAKLAPDERRLLCFAALTAAMRGVDLLERATRLEPGIGYRDMLSEAAAIRLDFEEDAEWMWPFDELPYPFR